MAPTRDNDSLHLRLATGLHDMADRCRDHDPRRSIWLVKLSCHGQSTSQLKISTPEESKIWANTDINRALRALEEANASSQALKLLRRSAILRSPEPTGYKSGFLDAETAGRSRGW